MFYSWRLLFSLPFFVVCSIFLSVNGVVVVIAFFLALVSAVLFYCFCSPFAFLSLPFFRPLLLTIYLRLLHVLVVLLGLFCPFYIHNWCLEILVYMSVLWAFCCTRFGFALLFSPPCFLYIFFCGLKVLYLCSVCPPVNIATTSTSCFAVSVLCILHTQYDRIHTRTDLLCRSKPYSRYAACP